LRKLGSTPGEMGTIAGVRLSAMANPARPALVFAMRLGEPAQPIARGITPYAISPTAVQPSGDSCARSMRWRKRSAAGRDARHGARRIACCGGSTVLRGNFCVRNVHELF